MHRRSKLYAVITLIAGLSLIGVKVEAQQATDLEAVKAANTAFYTALSSRDAKEMGALWANTPYVINIGPAGKAIIVGYEDAVAKYWPNAFTNVFSELNVTMTPVQVQANGRLAWVVGTENVKLKTKGGETREFTAFATNIFEMVDNRWLMVSHQAGIVPK